MRGAPEYCDQGVRIVLRGNGWRVQQSRWGDFINFYGIY